METVDIPNPVIVETDERLLERLELLTNEVSRAADELKAIRETLEQGFGPWTVEGGDDV